MATLQDTCVLRKPLLTTSSSCNNRTSNMVIQEEDRQEALLGDISLEVIETEEPRLINFGSAPGSSGVVDLEPKSSDLHQLFQLLEIDNRYRETPPSPIDPFKNHTPGVNNLYECIKILICIPVALVRLILFVLVVSIGFLTTKLAVMGWKDRHCPMPKWRCRLMWITRFAARGVLFCFGYHWIRRRGKPVSRNIAPIVVSNHMSYTDPIYFFYDLFPSIVTSESHDKVPIVGTIIRAMQVIYVDRFSSDSRKRAITEIKRKALCNEFPRVMLFPEGTTTNGRALISFHHGAFVSGYPIQPVIIRYPYVHFDQSWGNISLLRLLYRMLTQIHNFMEVEYLPVMFPVEMETKIPSLYGRKVGSAMARALNIVQTEHSYGDLILSGKATQLGLIPSSAYVVEMAKMERLFQLQTRDAISFLERFCSMHPNSSGQVSRDNFFEEMGLPRTSFSEQIFSFFDLDRQESISFSEYLYASMYILKRPKFHLACELAFRCCDTKERKYLSKHQIRHALELVFPHIHEDNVNKICKHFDMDDDKLVNVEEFTRYMQKNPVFILLFCTLINKKGALHAER